MKKIILFIVLLLLIGCARQEFSPDFHTGTEGLALEFLENAPPNEVWYIKDNPAKILIGIGLRNKGTEDITQGNIIVSSELGKIKIENSQADGIKKGIPRIKGRGFDFAEGEFIPLYYNAEVIGAEPGVPESLVDIEAKVCYKYKTTASAEICIDIVNPQYLQIKKSCESKKISSFTGQGAPIAISKIREDIIPGEDKNQLRLEIYLENKGQGKIVNDTCKTSDVLKIDEISFSDYSTKKEDEKKIKCEIVNNEIKIEENKENKIVCYADLDKNLNPYLAVLVTKLDYWYSKSIKKSVKIINTKYEEEIKITKERPIAFEEIKIGEFCDKISPKFDNEIKKYAKQYGIDPCLIMAIISVESGFNPNAVSNKDDPDPNIVHAFGLMQITYATADTLNIDKNRLTDPNINIEGGTRNLRNNYNEFKGKYNEVEVTRMAIAAHNAGPTGVQKIIDNYGSNWFDHLPPETRNFVPCVEYCWKEFKDKGSCNKDNNQYCKNLVRT